MTKTIDVARGDQIVAAARRWIGTPYRHQASRIRVGADCLGLVRGVFEEVMGRENAAEPELELNAQDVKEDHARLGIEAAQGFVGLLSPADFR